MARTPIARVAYHWTDATGDDDLLLVEHGGGLATAVALIGRRAVDDDGRPVDAAALPVGDIDAMVADLRAAALGDRLIAEGRCPECGEAVDVDFSLEAFRAHRAPRTARGAVACEGEGEGDIDRWSLERHGVTFRLPTAGDVLDAAAGDAPAAALAGACIDVIVGDAGASQSRTDVVGGEVGRAAVRAAERAMERLAPTLRDAVAGGCPACGAVVTLEVDARELCLEELRFLAQGVLEDVHVLAGAYGWTEPEILALPSRRRTAYAEFVHAGRGAAISAEAFGG